MFALNTRVPLLQASAKVLRRVCVYAPSACEEAGYERVHTRVRCQVYRLGRVAVGCARAGPRVGDTEQILRT